MPLNPDNFPYKLCAPNLEKPTEVPPEPGPVNVTAMLPWDIVREVQEDMSQTSENTKHHWPITRSIIEAVRDMPYYVDVFGEWKYRRRLEYPLVDVISKSRFDEGTHRQPLPDHISIPVDVPFETVRQIQAGTGTYKATELIGVAIESMREMPLSEEDSRVIAAAYASDMTKLPQHEEEVFRVRLKELTGREM